MRIKGEFRLRTLCFNCHFVARAACASVLLPGQRLPECAAWPVSLRKRPTAGPRHERTVYNIVCGRSACASDLLPVHTMTNHMRDILLRMVRGILRIGASAPSQPLWPGSRGLPPGSRRRSPRAEAARPRGSECDSTTNCTQTDDDQLCERDVCKNLDLCAKTLLLCAMFVSTLALKPTYNVASVLYHER